MKVLETELSKEISNKERLKKALNIFIIIVTVIFSNIQIILLVQSGIEDLRWKSDYSKYHKMDTQNVAIGQGGMDEYFDIYAIVLPYKKEEIDLYVYKWERREYVGTKWNVIEENSRQITFTEERAYVYRIIVYDMDDNKVGMSFYYTRRQYNFKSYDAFWQHFNFLIVGAIVGYAANHVISKILNKILRQLKDSLGRKEENKPF